MTRSQVYVFRGINSNFIQKASKSSFKLCFVKNDSMTPNIGESQGIEMVIKSDLDQIFIMSEKKWFLRERVVMGLESIYSETFPWQQIKHHFL